jgi:hypothetical protein
MLKQIELIITSFFELIQPFGITFFDIQMFVTTHYTYKCL